MKYFISHSYADVDERDALIASLPAGIQAVVFPQIRVSPDRIVSSELVSAILACDALVYLESESSANSFWVAFERDYALRAGKKVFQVKHKGALLEEHLGPPLDLATFASYSRNDLEQVKIICSHLKDERFFELFVDYADLDVGSDWSKTLESAKNDAIGRGGYVVVFWSESACASDYIESELVSVSKDSSGSGERVLFALLDETPLPSWRANDFGLVVQLYGDEERQAENRIDDLVVMLYWLIFRNSN